MNVDVITCDVILSSFFGPVSDRFWSEMVGFERINWPRRIKNEYETIICDYEILFDFELVSLGTMLNMFLYDFGNWKKFRFETYLTRIKFRLIQIQIQHLTKSQNFRKFSKFWSFIQFLIEPKNHNFVRNYLFLIKNVSNSRFLQNFEFFSKIIKIHRKCKWVMSFEFKLFREATSFNFV